MRGCNLKSEEYARGVAGASWLDGSLNRQNGSTHWLRRISFTQATLWGKMFTFSQYVRQAPQTYFWRAKMKKSPV